MGGARVVRQLLNIVEDVIDRLFRVVARDSLFDVGQQLGVVLRGLGFARMLAGYSRRVGGLFGTHIFVQPKLELDFDCLFQPLEAPFTLFLFQAGYGEEQLDRLFRLCGF